MRILLVNPPQSFYPGSDLVSGNLPLGIMYIAAVLELSGHKVEILDAFMDDSQPRTMGDTVEVGMHYDLIREEIRQKKPEIIGIANPFSTQIDHAKKIADIAKEIDPEVITVVGGPHVSVVPEQFLIEAENVDVAVVGEGEHTLVDVVSAKEGAKTFSDVAGIAYRGKNGRVILNQSRPFIKNLDELPYPAYHLVDMEKYLNPSKIEYRSFKPRSLAMITSRGCPHRCCFCSVHLHMGTSFRANSPEYVTDHLEFVVDKFRVKNVFFEDDNLTYDMKRMDSICDQIVQRGIKFSWETPNGIRADRVNMELLKKMKKSGCRSVFFGVESGDQCVSDKIVQKDLELERVVEAARNCKKINLTGGGFFIIGFPGEKKENMKQTVDFALKLKREYDFGMHLLIATPSYGTKLYAECKKQGYLHGEITPRALAEVRQTKGTPLIETEDFTAKDVKEIADMAIKEYKHISTINSIKFPRKTLSTLFHDPQIALKFIKNLLS